MFSSPYGNGNPTSNVYKSYDISQDRVRRIVFDKRKLESEMKDRKFKIELKRDCCIIITKAF